MRSERAHVLLERTLRDELDDGHVADLADTVAAVFGLLVVVRAAVVDQQVRGEEEEGDALVVLVVEDDGVGAGERRTVSGVEIKRAE